MSNTFKRITSRSVGGTRVQVGAYAVPGATTAIVIGMSVANVTSGTVEATIEHYDGANYTCIAKNVPVPAGGVLAPCGEMNKLVLEAADELFVTSDTATSLDVVVSLMEIA